VAHTTVPTDRSGATHYHVLGATISITADSDTTDGEYLVVDALVPPAVQNGLHTHGPSEVVHVIEGELRVHVAGEDRILGPGDSGYVPAGAVHGFENVGSEVCRVVAVMSPAGAEGFFAAVGQVADDRSLPDPVEPTEETLRALFATGAEYGFEFFGPLPDLAASVPRGPWRDAPPVRR
jgi:quercetin dioxygenase-like cupin family protein